MKSWIDVATTDTPTLLLEQAIHSFLVAFDDRKDFNLRWVYHLDQYPKPGLEKYWEQNLKMALKLRSWFDDSLIMASSTNQSYGTSVVRVMQEIRNDVFWMESDKIWIRHFRLDDIKKLMEASGATSYVFYHSPVAGTTTPTFRTIDELKIYRDNAPEPSYKITEKTWTEIARRYNIKAIGPSPAELGKQIKRRLWENSFWTDMGKHQLRFLLGKRFNVLHPARCWFDKESNQEFRG